MKTLYTTLIVFTLSLVFTAFSDSYAQSYSLTIKVENLRNSEGIVQFALYNKEGSIPDKNYEKYFKILKGEIDSTTATVTFKNLPSGKYAVNILHDENKNGEIDKGFILPIEGIGFSNFESIAITNRPNFSKASFELNENKSINIKIIYM